ncbi:unnamed protein product, partial [Effrenium voratum]
MSRLGDSLPAQRRAWADIASDDEEPVGFAFKEPPLQERGVSPRENAEALDDQSEANSVEDSQEVAWRNEKEADEEVEETTAEEHAEQAEEEEEQEEDPWKEDEWKEDEWREEWNEDWKEEEWKEEEWKEEKEEEQEEEKEEEGKEEEEKEEAKQEGVEQASPDQPERRRNESQDLPLLDSALVLAQRLRCLAQELPEPADQEASTELAAHDVERMQSTRARLERHRRNREKLSLLPGKEAELQASKSRLAKLRQELMDCVKAREARSQQQAEEVAGLEREVQVDAEEEEMQATQHQEAELRKVKAENQELLRAAQQVRNEDTGSKKELEAMEDEIRRLK